METSLRQIFADLAGSYTNDHNLISVCWEEIAKYYTGKKRYYHNLDHLQQVYSSLFDCRNEINDWNAVLFALFYHDAIYHATKKDNEEKSAELAQKRMKEMKVDAATIESARSHILATKSHSISANNDTNLFTDADLGILGAEWKDYTLYFQKIRKEYSIYPDFMYNPGRKKVLEHFLNMEPIFKTAYFRNKLESNARNNLQREAESLS